jgi:four helix bundle protein
MKEANPILEMSYRFALDVTAAARIMRERKEYDLASQFWRSGTSIGANKSKGSGINS